MADYMGTTASSGAKIKKSKVKELEAYLAKWDLSAGEGGVSVDIRENNGKLSLHVYGDDDFSPYLVVTKEQAEEDDNLEEGTPNFDEGSDCDGFVKGLAPFLDVSGKGKEKFLIVIQTVGNEKCRFPLGACEWVLLPNGKLKTNGFTNWGS